MKTQIINARKSLEAVGLELEIMLATLRTQQKAMAKIYKDLGDLAEAIDAQTP